MAWDSSAHPRVQAGGAGGGEFAPASGGSGGSGSKGAKASKGIKGSAAAARPTPTNQHPVGTGEHGKRVSDLQERLNALGAHLKADGVFGPKTLAAVKAFQKSHGLKVDGLVGPKTTAALREEKQPAHKNAPHKGHAHKAPAHRSQTWAARWAETWASGAQESRDG
jgi:peptidoglycan hydrolase-like protein with peptidoglycan-binding domain